MTEVILNTVTARQLPDPFDSSIKEYSFFVDARSLPKIGLKANPRSQHKSKVWKQIEHSLMEPTIKFHRLNRGLRIMADSVTRGKTNDSWIIKYDEKTQGILNGGSTARKIWEMQKKKIPEGKLVKVTVETGLDLKEIIQMAKADNLADPVPEFTLLNMSGGFDFLKRITKGFPIEICYRQGDPGIDVRQILSILALFNPDFCRTTHDEMFAEKKGTKLFPNNIHHSRNTVLKRFTADPASFRKFSPEMVSDILSLYDFLQVEIRRQVGAKIVKRRYMQSNVQQTLWMEKKTFPNRLPQGFGYPMAFAASQYVNTGDTKFSWSVPVPQIRAAYRKALPNMLRFIETAARNEITPDNFAKKPANLSNWATMQNFLKSNLPA